MRSLWRNDHRELATAIDRLHSDKAIEDVANKECSAFQKARLRRLFEEKHPEIACQIPELRKYMATLRHREKTRQQRLANPEKAKTRVRQWKRANPGKSLEYYHRRRAQMGGKPDPKVQKYFQLVRTHPGLFCHICRRPIPLNERSVDHVVPLCRGGKHELSNLAPAHRLCNAKKRDKLMEEIWASY